MTTALNIGPAFRGLYVGSGSAYQAAEPDHRFRSIEPGAARHSLEPNCARPRNPPTFWGDVFKHKLQDKFDSREPLGDQFRVTMTLCST